MGHMNVMWYTGKFDEASWHFLSNLGLTRTILRDQNRALAAVQQNITYKRELHAGDIITVRSGIFEIREKTIKFLHEMKNDETGEVAAFAVMTGVHMDSTKRRSCPFPEDVLERAREIIAGNDQWVISDTRPFYNELPFASVAV
jgi:acyl-CoA thioester hydrolase